MAQLRWIFCEFDGSRGVSFQILIARDLESKLLPDLFSSAQAQGEFGC